jgi:hypothetical protein
MAKDTYIENESTDGWIHIFEKRARTDLHGGELPHEGVALGHALHPQGHGQRDDGDQALRDDGEGEGDTHLCSALHWV